MTATVIRSISLALGLLLLSACSDDREPGDHVWKEQTDAIKKAEDVERLLMETDERRRELIEQQSR